MSTEQNISERLPKDKGSIGPHANQPAAGILQRIVAAKRNEVALLEPDQAEWQARANDMAPARPFGAALQRPLEVRVLAEVKRRSPSAGEIRPAAEPGEVARAYEAGGAAAISVLTDGPFFGGSLHDLERVRESVSLPLLRKDFVVHPVQVWQARAAGADAVLLIARILDDPQLLRLWETAEDAGLDVLLEVHSGPELARALELGFPLIGVNNRDLDTFATDLGVVLALAASVPAGVGLVAESGIRTAVDVQRLGAAGVDAVLVGESLMRQPDLRAAVGALATHPKQHRGAR